MVHGSLIALGIQMYLQNIASFYKANQKGQDLYSFIPFQDKETDIWSLSLDVRPCHNPHYTDEPFQIEHPYMRLHQLLGYISYWTGVYLQPP